MQIGIRLHDTREGVLDQRLSYARAQGFECAHLAMSKAVPGFTMADAPRLLTEALADKVKNTFSKYQMDCAVLGCYLNLTDRDEERREKTRAVYRAHFRFARLMGARVVGSETAPAKGTVFAENPSQSEEAFRFFLDCLRPLVRDAEEEGADFAIEPVAYHIISTPERAERMLEAVRSDRLKIILDAVNLLLPETVNQADAIIQDAVRRLGDKITVLHLKDYHPVSAEDEKLSCCACGTGEMKYDRLLRYAVKYGLPMTLENTVPENAEAARLYLEDLAKNL